MRLTVMTEGVPIPWYCIHTAVYKFISGQIKNVRKPHILLYSNCSLLTLDCCLAVLWPRRGTWRLVFHRARCGVLVMERGFCCARCYIGI